MTRRLSVIRAEIAREITADAVTETRVSGMLCSEGIVWNDGAPHFVQPPDTHSCAISPRIQTKADRGGE
jgi:hypothetical protein